MAETEKPTFETACLCPKCGRPGDARTQQQAPGMPRGTKLHHVFCTTQMCPWYNTEWLVQTNPDGSVPAPKNHTGGKKLYAGFSDHDRQAEELINILKQNAQRETGKDASGGKGYEVRG